MDKIDQYRQIVCNLIQEYAKYKPSHGQINTEAILDRDRDHYELMHVGWDDHDGSMALLSISTSSTVRSGSSMMALRVPSSRN